jgi:hypothetical protein
MPALDLQTDSSKKQAFVRYLFLSRDVILLSVAQEGTAKVPAADAEKFFNSLQIEKRPK